MSDILLSTIASDLKMVKFTNENKPSFINRVLYSATACWIKTSTQDFEIIDGKHKTVSKKHVYHRCNEVLECFLEEFSTARSYFSDDENPDFNAVKEIRRRLIQNGDIVTVGFGTEIGLSTMKTVPLSNRIAQLCGSLNCFDHYAGISTIAYKNNDNKVFRKTSLAWFEDYIKAVNWIEKPRDTSKLQIFNPKNNSLSNYQCWEDYIYKPINGIFLLRDVTDFGYRYYLEKREEGSRYYHDLDFEYFRKTLDYIRIQFVLRLVSGNSPKAFVITHPDSIEVELKTMLPQYEKSIFESFAWPKYRISDSLNWIMLPEVWEFVKKYLIDLGIEIEEK